MATYREYKAQTRRRKNKRTFRRFLIILVLVSLILVLSWGIVKIIDPEESTPIVIPEIPMETVQTNDSVNSGWSETAGPFEQTINEWSLITPDFRMIALPENGMVEESYFDDAIFVGDSLAQGFEVYNTFENASYATYKGVSPSALYDGTLCARVDGTTELPLDAIADSVPGKVYICMGTNGLVWMDDDDLVADYGEFIDVLGTRVPGALIYVMSIPPVTAKATADRAQMNNERINEINDKLAKMAYEKGIYFLDSYEALAQSDGYLRADIAGSDGIHMRDSSGYNVWKQYLMTHVAHREGNPYLAGSPYYVAPTQDVPVEDTPVEEVPVEDSAV